MSGMYWIEEYNGRIIRQLHTVASKDRIRVEKIDQEIEKIKVEYSEAQNRAQTAYDL